MSDSAFSPEDGAKPPLISYVVCASPRTGSNLLCEALWHTWVAGRPAEHFLYWYQSVHEPERLRTPEERSWLVPPEEYLRKVIVEGSTPNQVFGTKLMGTYLGFVFERLAAMPRFAGLSRSQALAALFPDLRYVYMTRTDKIRQAVSQAKAEQSGKWLVKVPPRRNRDQPEPKTAPNEPPLVYNRVQIAGCLRAIVEQEQAWETYFRDEGIAPLRVTYECFSEAYDETRLDVMTYLGIPAPPPKKIYRRSMQRQSDTVNDEWAERFAAEGGRPA